MISESCLTFSWLVMLNMKGENVASILRAGPDTGASRASSSATPG